MRFFAAFNALKQDARGSMAIETAFVVPLLALMALGTVDMGLLVSRQQELQSAALEAEGIIMGTIDPDTISDTQIEDILEASLALRDDQLDIARAYRCDSGNLGNTQGGCATDQQEYEYVELTLTDTYTPSWTYLGIGQASNFTVTRTVQIQ